MNFFFNKFIYCDAPQPWGFYFQDSASPQMEALIELHDNIMFYLVIILLGVAWIVISIMRNYIINKSPISNKYLNHGTLIELIWTITPALILILIAFPSFKLLYLMDEVTDPSLTVFVEGHQWYWSYQYPDFLNDDNEELEFDSYLVPESDLEEGALRLLEVDNRVNLLHLLDWDAFIWDYSSFMNNANQAGMGVNHFKYSINYITEPYLELSFGQARINDTHYFLYDLNNAQINGHSAHEQLSINNARRFFTMHQGSYGEIRRGIVSSRGYVVATLDKAMVDSNNVIVRCRGTIVEPINSTVNTGFYEYKMPKEV